MATIAFEGPYLPGEQPGKASIYSISGYSSGYWHGGPSMVGGGYLTANRNGSTISGSVSDAYCVLRSGSYYNFPVILSVNFVSDDGTVDTEIARESSPYGGNWSGVGFDFSINTNLSGTIIVYYSCGDTCTKGYQDVIMSGDIHIDSYNPSHPATDGWVHSTNNTGNVHSLNEYVSNGSISSYGYNQVWFSWTGDLGVDQFAIDFNKTNNSSTASSISSTSNYTKNTKISLYTLMKDKGYRIGDTIYCWVACRIGSTWTKTYLGTITPQKRGYIYFKDGSNYRDCTSTFYKNNSISNAKYVLIKDSSGTIRIVDVLTDLYN